MLNERLQRMRNKLWDSKPCITAERLELETEAYKQFAGDAIPIFRAKVVNYIMERMTTLIMEDELIVGTATNKYRGANLHPEFQSSSWYESDIDEFPVRSKDPYDISPEDREKILELLPYWKGKSMEEPCPRQHFLHTLRSAFRTILLPLKSAKRCFRRDHL